MRAVETDREDAILRDPFARALAGEEGFAVMAKGDPPSSVPRPPVVAVRTRFFDDAIVASLGSGIRNLVLVAAGMDSRAFRLELPPGTRVFEIDQPAVLAYKAAKLGSAVPLAERIAIPVDLRGDWPAALEGAGFSPGERAVWLVEGLLTYLRPADVRTLLTRITELSAPGSEILFDVPGRFVLDSPYMKERLEFVASLGAPWQFATDTPEELLAPLGWSAVVEDHGTIGHQYGRWPLPVFPRGTPGVPQSFLVRGVKRG
jgi:methyltransferase (TIGR00027 family)